MFFLNDNKRLNNQNSDKKKRHLKYESRAEMANDE